MNLDYNSFEGFEIEGRPHVVTVRGKVAARDGKFVSEFGREGSLSASLHTFS
jgi:dihydropyrimidinase